MIIWPRVLRSSGQGLACDHERCPQVHVELEVDLLGLLLCERSADADARAVHEHVHAAVAFGVCGDHANALVGVAQVRGHRQRIQLRGRCVERLGPPSRERERIPVRPQRASDRQSDSRRSTRNECRLHGASLWIKPLSSSGWLLGRRAIYSPVGQQRGISHCAEEGGPAGGNIVSPRET